MSQILCLEFVPKEALQKTRKWKRKNKSVNESDIIVSSEYELRETVNVFRVQSSSPWRIYMWLVKNVMTICRWRINIFIPLKLKSYSKGACV